MPKNAHPDSTFSSHVHNDWTHAQIETNEYPQPDIRGPMPKNAHPDSTFSSHVHNDWTHAQLSSDEYPQPDIRGPMPKNAHPDSTFSSHVHNDWTHAQLSADEYPQPDIRGPMPKNAHPDSTFSSHVHNDWTHAQLSADEYPQPDIRGPMPKNAHPDSTFSSHVHNDWTHWRGSVWPRMSRDVFWILFDLVVQFLQNSILYSLHNYKIEIAFKWWWLSQFHYYFPFATHMLPVISRKYIQTHIRWNFLSESSIFRSTQWKRRDSMLVFKYYH